MIAGRALVVPAVAVMAACGTAGTEPARTSEAVAAARGPGFRDEPWSYNGRGGLAISTPHYRLFTTQTDPAIIGRVPAFMEAMLAHYRTVATGPDAPLPEPTGTPMHAFLFRDREDWERLTRHLLAENAAAFLRIRRGGYAWGGQAVLLDPGLPDTFTLLAHEGWHQFAQRTFRQPLPPWLEEGIATLCEGRDPVGRLDPAHNPERRERLAAVVSGGRLMSLERLSLLPGVPGAEPSGSDSSEALDYYAQTWAAAMFLRFGGGTALSTALRSCITDACEGRLAATMIERLGTERAASLAARARGLAVLEAYFARDPSELAEIEAAYRAFVLGLARAG